MIDGRLAVPALGAWAASAGLLAASQTVPDPAERHVLIGWLAIGTALLAVALLGIAFLRRAQVVALIALGIIAGGGAMLLQVHALTDDPMATWVRQRATATVTGVITADPTSRTRSQAAIWQSAAVTDVRLATSKVHSRGATYALDVPIILRVTGTGSVPAAGTQVEVTGRLLRARAPDVAAVLTVGADGAIRVITGPGVVDAVANAMRTGLRDSVRGVAPDAAALVTGLAVGDESLQSDDLAEVMQRSGLSHLTAVSGGNVAIILAVVLGLTRVARLRMPMRVVLGLAALAFFVILVRPQPSVMRAAVMGVVMLLALLTGGRQRAVSVLSFAVLALAILAPMLAASWGFALSAFATAGLILLAPSIDGVLARRLPRWPPALREGLAVTLAAQIATAPLLVAMGAAFGWVAIPANLLAMPAVGAVTVLGLGAAITSPIVPIAGTALGHLASWPAHWIAQVARTCAELPFAAFPLPAGWQGLLLLMSITAGAWLGIRRLRARFPTGIPRSTLLLIAIPAVAVALLLTLAPPRARGWPPPGWLLVACDVGQGDALVARSDDAEAVVIDAGPDPRSIRRCLDDLHVRMVSAVVLTHFHADHVNGLPGILDHFPVGAVYVTPVPDPPDEVQLVDRWLGEHGLAAQVSAVGDVRAVGAVTWRALWPRRVIRRGSVPNNASVVLAMDVSGTRILLPGDVEAEAQTAIIAQEPGLRVDVMKVPHHGSGNQSPRLPTWSGARIALVSCGLGNSYGHPHPDTLAAWAGALLGRTDLDGDLAVVRGAEGRLGLVTHGT